jgi:hypothetical protein
MPPARTHDELCRSGDYRVLERFDMALLAWPEGELIVGDHCRTDPQCAAISIESGWCVTGGEGLAICLFADGLPHGPNPPDPARITWSYLWRHENPPPGNAPHWFVAEIWRKRDDLIDVRVEAGGEEAGLYEVDVRSLRWARVGP